MDKEFEWINSLLLRAGALASGVGDDAFVCGKHLISADMSVEGTHFRLDWSSPGQVVEKCLLSNFSDINAMGGRSEAILLSICMNKRWNEKIRAEIANAMAEVCKKHKIKILGGDTTEGDIGVFSVTVFGKAKHKVLLRSAAKVGDDVWVSGIPGRSGKGLELLKRGGKFNAQEQEFVNLHKVPKPPLMLGEQLAKIKGIGACIDLSDSLAEGLQHISKQSKVQIKIEEKVELNGGEDYELLFTARKSARKSILQLTKKFLLQRIGVAT
jgi:thiamine-monophosphate kinase